ncbi:tRNA (guanine-N(7)-)-methyltransferase non-catalytic subunit WDR4 [Schistocerca serialis cubense]|uniref:tRNA (guanine-N(7)-)-methyltransferase non-catalytic subunit WDR4 n=1 Tax=Schistocerca serialis cubense TaxID=2023355 RepID=UPI00214E31DC|nr:tRNA (guanine-N(7)-)-methyltransferase non-catalytic subunit WDR4 [Schistocerca serialis cubense]
MSPSLHMNQTCTVVTVDSTVLTSKNCDEVKTIDVAELNESVQHVSHESHENEEETIVRCITCASLSDCGTWFAACTNDKRLYQWRTVSWTLSSVRILNRAASSVKFTPTAQGIVVADKTGDAYLFSVQNNTENGQLLLGHLSMLLDVIISSCENFIVTCDRDEKIRVSRFPNAYNIQSYCLGHEEFVSRIEFFPGDRNILVSGSGDGSVRFWDYLEGRQIGIIHCDSDVKMKSCQESNGEADDNCGSKEPLAVRHFSAKESSKGVNILAVTLATFSGCILYSISGNITAVHSVLLNVLALDVEPWDILLTENQELWCLASVERHPVSVYMYNDKTSEFLPNGQSVDCKSEFLANSFNSKWDLFKSVPPPMIEPVMHKRRFDDLQEYKERKRQRLADKSL